MSSMWDRKPRKPRRTVGEDFRDEWARRIGLWSIPFRVLAGAIKRLFYGPAALLHTVPGRVVFCAGAAALMLDAAFGSDGVNIPLLGNLGWLALFVFGCFAWRRRMRWEEQLRAILHAAVPGHSHAVPVVAWFPPRILGFFNLGRWRGRPDFAFRIPGGLAASKAPEVEEILRQRLPAAKGFSWRFTWDFRRGVCAAEIREDLPEGEPLRHEDSALPSRNGSRNGRAAAPSGTAEKVPLGKSLNGVVYWVLDSNFGNLLVTGSPGGGKSVLVNSVARHCFKPEFASHFDLYGIDMKGGVELSHLTKFRNFRRVAEDLDSALDLLRRLRREVDRRQRMLRQSGTKKIAELNARREAAGEKRLKRLILLVDELAELTDVPEVAGKSPEEKAENQKRAECKALLDSIIRLGRAGGIHCVCALQRPDVRYMTGAMRSNIQARVATGRLDQAGCQMLESKLAGELPGKPGRGVFWEGGQEQVVQFYYTADEDLDAFLPRNGSSKNGPSGGGEGGP